MLIETVLSTFVLDSECFDVEKAKLMARLYVFAEFRMVVESEGESIQTFQLCSW